MGAWLGRTRMLWLVGAATLFLNLGVPRLWDRDEPRNAGCAEEMLARHDWVVPVFNGELRSHKPVLLYWGMMLTQQLPLDREFAARLPSALFGLGTMVATYWIGCRIYGESTGRLSGLILATSLMFLVAGRAATPDAPLIFFSTLALLAFVYAAFSPLPAGVVDAPLGQERGWQLSAWQAFGMYSAMALAVLAKGPVGVVLPLAVVLGFALIDQHDQFNPATGSWGAWCKGLWRWLFPLFRPAGLLKVPLQLHPLMLLVALTYIAAPWYIWVGIRTDGAWLREFFTEHNLGRALHTLEGHQGGLWFYPLAILVGFFPWSAFIVPLGIYNSHWRTMSLRERRAITLLSLWVLVYVGAFSLARTKLPSYVTPTYPALALLMSRFLHVASVPSRLLLPWMRASFGVLVAVGVSLLVALPFVLQRFLPGESWLATLGLWPLMIGILGWWHWSCQERVKFHRVLVAGATMFSIWLFGLALLRVDRHQQNDRLLQLSAMSDMGVSVAAFGVLEPSWVYYSGRTIEFIERDRREQLDNFLQRSGPHFLLATTADAQVLETEFASQISRVTSVPYFLHAGDVVLFADAPGQRVLSAHAASSSTLR